MGRLRAVKGQFARCEVLGFGVAKGVSALRIDRMGPDNYWFGARSQILLDRRGAGVDGMFARRYRYRARAETPQKAGAGAAASNSADRAASRCLTEGAVSSRVDASIQVATRTGCTAAIDGTPALADQAKNSSAAR